VHPYDIVMLVVLAVATTFGLWKGLAWQIASLGSIFASYFVAYQLRGPVSTLISADPPWNVFAAMLILYVATSAIIWIAFHVVSGFIDRVKLKEFDRQLGAIFGLAKGILLCVVITLFGVTVLGEGHRESIIHSRSGYYIAVLLDKAHGVMPAEIHEVLEPYIHSLDERLDRPGGANHGENWRADRT
jgi:membrane protein required for colicin V production